MPDPDGTAITRVAAWLDGHDRSDRGPYGPRSADGVLATSWTDDTPDLTDADLRAVLDLARQAEAYRVALESIGYCTIVLDGLAKTDPGNAAQVAGFVRTAIRSHAARAGIQTEDGVPA